MKHETFEDFLTGKHSSFTQLNKNINEYFYAKIRESLFDKWYKNYL